MLFRKMLRDLRVNKSQFIAIFLMIFLGVFIFAGVNSDWNGMRVNSQNFYEESNMADVWVYGNGFTADDVNRLRDTAGIDKVERKAVLPANVKGNQKKKIELNIMEDSSISKMKIMKGEAYDADTDGIWLDQSYADENHIKPGDSLTLTMNGIELKKTVIGLIMHPEYVYQNADGNILPDHKNSGYAFISSTHVPYAQQLPYTQLLIKTDKPENMESVVSGALEKRNLTFVQRDDLLSYQTLEDEITQHQAFGEIFPIVFLLIAVLTTLTTVSKMIMNQRLQIGILKALGFSSFKIKIHYLSHTIVIASAGALLGYVSGPRIVPALIYPMLKTAYTLPSWQPHALLTSALMVVLSIALCFFASYMVCRKQLKEKASDLLRPAVSTYRRKKEQHGKLWDMLNFYAQWNIRDIMRNKIRSLIAVLGVMGCTGLLLCAFGLHDSMNHMMDMMFKELQTYEIRVNVDESADIAELKEKINGSAVQENAIELKKDGETETAMLNVQEDTKYLKLQNENLHNIDLPEDGAALSYKIAQRDGYKKGDRITWRIVGSRYWHTTVVKDIIHTPSSQGITMSKQTYLNSKETFIPTAVVGLDREVKNETGVQSVKNLKEDIASSMDTMMEGMNLMIVILMAGAVVLGIVVLYNIGTFSYMEKIHDMATLKVLGFRSEKIKKLLRQQNLWLTLIGVLGGLPFGYALIYSVLSTTGDAMDILIIIQPFTYMGCILATLVVSMLVIVIVSRKIRHIDMVSALKAME